eukprot:TRINITY_DN2266_c0_g1_i3.p1 TRINITY_DN2266_c0_g1~~TRINITY_DN2266_c0_g1_i3.p1  ORF type:complete len:588 (-),score=267.17 TRINITY_DN2266_c0_g1_i3:199-1962(-)
MQHTPTFASASLYVGDVHPDLNESQLYDIFKQLGAIASIRVCRDTVTRRSLGYAYVNFHNVADAERCIDVMNSKEVKGKALRIMWSQRDPQLRKSNVGNVFVKNLSKEVDNKFLQDTFSVFGNILSAKVSTDEKGASKGHGFVHFESAESAEAAIQKINGETYFGKKWFVGPFQAKKERSPEETEEKWTNVYVKHLDPSVDEEKLKEMFSKWGPLTSVVIMRDESGASKGFGFLNFETHEKASNAIEALNDKEVDGKTIYVGKAQKKGEREKELKDMFNKIQNERLSKYQGVNLYVKNLDESVDDEKLRQEFATCGTITSAKVMTDEKNLSKGFGFVCYATPEEATKAVTELNGKPLNGKEIYVALAQKKDQRKANLENQHTKRGGQAKATGPVYFPQPGFVYPPQVLQGGATQRGQRNRKSGNAPNARENNRGTKGGQPRATTAGAKQPTGIKYNNNVRNSGNGRLLNVVPNFGTVAVTADEVAKMNPDDQRNTVGEHLYGMIGLILVSNGLGDDLSGKITGMLLESIGAVDLVSLMQSKEALIRKIEEALVVLQVHQPEQSGEAPAATEAVPAAQEEVKSETKAE